MNNNRGTDTYHSCYYNDGNSTAYDYDLLGNRTGVINGGTTTYASNALNQYVKVADVNYTYDKNGNLTYDGQFTYIYDYENRLLEVKQGETTVVSYAYDYKGKRVAKTVGSSTTTYLYDGDQIIADYNEAGTCQRRYFYGPGIDEPICMMKSVFTYYYHFDGLGSVAALSNSSAIVEKYRYDVFGRPEIRGPNDESRATSLYSNRYMFTGREFEPETGLYYYRARYYHPQIGRFLQTDSTYYSDGLNLYSYVWNNPVNWLDPKGLASWPSIICGGICGGIGALVCSGLSTGPQIIGAIAFGALCAILCDPPDRKIGPIPDPIDPAEPPMFPPGPMPPPPGDGPYRPSPGDPSPL